MSKEKLIPELRFPEFKGDEEWSHRNLGEVGEFIGGGTPSTSNSEYWDGDILWYTPTEVKNGILNPSIRTITKDGLQSSSAKLLPIGTILITTRATIGDAAIANKECTTNQGFQSLFVNESEHNQFWYYWIIHHKHELERRSSGSTFKEIGKTEIKIIPTLSPRKEEQQKIASCLSSLDELIAAHNDKLDALKDHKKGLLQNLFPQEGETVPKVRFPEFENDREWKEIRLKQAAHFYRGLTYGKGDTSDSGLLVLRSGNIQNDTLVLDKDLVYVVKECSDELNLLQGDVVICMSNGSKSLVGKNAEYQGEYDGEITVGAFCSIMRPRNKFTKYILKTDAYQKFIRLSIGGGNINNLKNSDLEEYECAVPSTTEEQQKIASCLSSLDELITAQQEKIEQLQQHKKGLMQGLFPKIAD